MDTRSPVEKAIGSINESRIGPLYNAANQLRSAGYAGDLQELLRISEELKALTAKLERKVARCPAI